MCRAVSAADMGATFPATEKRVRESAQREIPEQAQGCPALAVASGSGAQGGGGGGRLA